MCLHIVPRYYCNHSAGPDRIAYCDEVPPGFFHMSLLRWPELHVGFCKNCREDLKADREMRPRKDRGDKLDTKEMGTGASKRQTNNSKSQS